MRTASSPQDNDTTATGMDPRRQLVAELARLRRDILDDAAHYLYRFREYFPSSRFTKSAWNLSHYLALRRHDLRQLQDRLAERGVSSLGRSESHILASLDRVIELLMGPEPAATAPDLEAAAEAPEFREGIDLLNAHSEALLGPSPSGHKARIMVTLPTAAASDPALVLQLLQTGMDCARINCAHDDPAAWAGMLRNLRAAEQATGRRCRLLMDLAGHKLRTGAVARGPAVLHLKVQRDLRGRIRAPARVRLLAQTAPEGTGSAPYTADSTQLRLPARVFEALAAGDRLRFTDVRGKQRDLYLVQRQEQSWLAECRRNTYLGSNTRMRWQRPDPATASYATLERFELPAFAGSPLSIRLFCDDLLLLTRRAAPGIPPQRDEHGQCRVPARIACTAPQVLDDLLPGAAVWIDDGRLGAVVETLDAEGALLRITHAQPAGERLRPGKGLNFPDTRLSLPPLSQADLQALDFACHHADLIGFSFVEELSDMDALIEALAARSDRPPAIIAKIETRRAVANLPELILGTLGRHPLGVMIARGDLAVELGGERLAEMQEEILWLCEAAHIPVIWATQVLEAMARKGIIHRPELTDAAMSGRAECVMLNKGPYILQALQTLDDILRRMEAHQYKKGARLRALHW